MYVTLNHVILLLVSGIFRANNLFIGANCREATNAGRADFIPIFLGDIPLLFRRKILKLDVALVQVLIYIHAPHLQYMQCSVFFGSN